MQHCASASSLCAVDHLTMKIAQYRFLKNYYLWCNDGMLLWGCGESLVCFWIQPWEPSYEHQHFYLMKGTSHTMLFPPILFILVSGPDASQLSSVDFLCIHVQIPLLHHLQVAIILWDLIVSWILLWWWWWWWLLLQEHSPPKETCQSDYPVNRRPFDPHR